MLKNKQLLINFIATIISFVINALINFILSSYIVKNVNAEAYGFVQLANTFITYFTVITIAINSMASRFISISYYKEDYDEAKSYYSSTFWANIIIMALALPIIILFIANIESFVKISPELITDVKWLFVFLAGNMYLGLITTNLTVSFYIKNKLHLQAIINAISHILKAVLLYLLYLKFPPYVAFIGLTTFIASAFIQTASLYYKNKLIPEIKIGKCDLKKIKTLLMSGLWNSITRIGNILSDGLDLLITNLFLDATSMGILAIVKTIPNIISNVLNSLVSIFMPSMTKVYATGTSKEFTKETKKAMNFVGIFLNLPIICLIVLGDVLFTLWFPTQDATLLHVLSILAISHWIVIGPVSIVHNVFTVINKIKVNSILVCITGLLNVGIVYVLLKTTSLGLYAIVAVSTSLSIIRNLFYTLIYGAKYIGEKWWTFFPEIFKSLLSIGIDLAIGITLKQIINPASWMDLIIVAAILCLISFVVNCLVSVSNEDKKMYFSKIMNRKGVKNG